MRRSNEVLLSLVLIGVMAVSAGGVTLGISTDGKWFTLDGTPTYLLGVSYYGAQTITTADFRTQDLDDMVARGFNWIRIFARWNTERDGTGIDVSVVEKSGSVREPYMTRLKTLIAECNNRGMIVDVTMSRARVDSNQQLMDVWMTLANQLAPYRNVYFDIANESDNADRFVSYSFMGQIVTAIKAIDPGRLCTASRVPTDADDLEDLYLVGKGDFACPHLCRGEGCSAETLATVKQYVGWMNQRSFRIPVHLQEPFNRDYEHSSYDPQTTDYYRDCGGAKLAEAGGWCLHNGAWPPHAYRSFKMTDDEGRLFAQFDSVETAAAANVHAEVGGTDPLVRRYQAEYGEQLAKQIGRTDGLARSANTTQDSAGYLSYGPYLATLPTDTYQVTWRMSIDDNTSDNSAVVTLDIRDATAGVVKATRIITRQEFAAADTYQDFTLTLSYADSGHMMEFRTYWHDNSYLKLDYIDVCPQRPPVIREVSPDPDVVYAGSEYVRQLSLSNHASPVPTWSVVSGPSGVQVSETGLVYGWTPLAAGAYTIVVRATNVAGSDDESWQVQVESLPAGTIALFPFNSDAQGWTLGLWKAGTHGEGAIAWDAASGNPDGNVKSTGSGSTNNTDSCTREGSILTRSVSTVGFDSIQVEYDLIAVLNTPPDSGCGGTCTGAVLEGSCQDKLAVYYSTAGTSGPWTLAQVLTEGIDLPAAWTHEVINLAGVSAANNNPDFAVRFKWQFNTAADAGRIDNVVVKGSSITGNQAPQVDAGPDQAVRLPNSADLDGTVTDDGLPDPPGAVTVTWIMQSGPGTVTFGDAHAVDTTASFSAAGSYVLKLYASDSQLSGQGVVSITVNAPAAADFDVDGDVDQKDFGFFQACLSGSSVPYSPGCEDADLNGSGDVDQTDFALFQDCLSGSGNPPGC